MKRFSFSPVAKVVFTALIVTAFASSAFARQSEKRINASIEGYTQAIESGATQLTETAIYNVIRFNRKYPTADYTNVLEALNRTSIEGENEQIRFKAHLAVTVMKNNELLTGVEFYEFEDQQQFYNAVARKMLARNIAALQDKMD